MRLRGAASSSSRATAQAAVAQLAPRSAIARGPRNAMHGMSAAGTHALQRLQLLGASTRYLCLTGSGGAGRRAARVHLLPHPITSEIVASATPCQRIVTSGGVSAGRDRN